MMASLCHYRKDPHGFFAFPVTDAIAPGYSMIIKHPMDFSTMKDKIATNEYKTVTEFKVRPSRLCRQVGREWLPM